MVAEAALARGEDDLAGPRAAGPLVSLLTPAAAFRIGLPAPRDRWFYPQGGFADVWDGGRWVATAAGLPRTSPLNGVACVASGDCFAAGQYDPRTITSPATQQPLLLHWAAGRWSRVAIPAVATLTNPEWNAGNLIDPDLFGIACVAQTGCTAVGAQPQSGRSAPLVISDLPAPPG